MDAANFLFHLNGYEVSDRLLFRYDDVTVATKIYPSLIHHRVERL